MNVHNSLACGFQEGIFHNALKVEFNHQDVVHRDEFEIPIFYRNAQVGTRRVDFIIDDVVMIEIKACTELLDIHIAQAINFRSLPIRNRVVDQFGSQKLQMKSLYNNKKIAKLS